MTLTATPSVKIIPEVVGKALYLEFVPTLDEEGKPVGRHWGGKDSVKQVFVTPSGYDLAGNLVPSKVFERTVTTYSPRAQWDSRKVIPMPSAEELLRAHLEEEKSSGRETDYISANQIPASEFDHLSDEIKNSYYANSIAHTLKQTILASSNERVELPEGGYEYVTKVVKAWDLSQKFAVEVTNDDLGVIRDSKTPQAIIRRINKTRVANGYAEKLV